MGVFLSILVLLAVATAAQANDVVVQVKGGALVIIGDDDAEAVIVVDAGTDLKEVVAIAPGKRKNDGV